MLKISKSIKKTIANLTSRGHPWTLPKLEKAIKLIYGKRITIIKMIGAFKGQRTRFQLQCNECGYGSKKDGTVWIVSAKTLIHHPSCPRCMFCGKCHKLGYLIVQKRLNKQHRPIIIKPLHNQLYKNQNTKVLAYNYKSHEKWIVSVNNVLHGRNAPQSSHLNGYKKEAQKRSYQDYAKMVANKWNGLVITKPLATFHSKQKSPILATNTKDNFSWKTNFEELLAIKYPKHQPKSKK